MIKSRKRQEQIVRMLIWLLFFTPYGVRTAIAGDTGEFIWGMNTHLMNLQDIDSRVRLLGALGVTSFRDGADWNTAEKSIGEYSFPSTWDGYVASANNAGIRPLLIIHHGNKLYEDGAMPITKSVRDAFVAYAKALAEHFKGRVGLYEIWNEWNMDDPASAKEYVQLLREVYPAIKSVDQNAKVIGGDFGLRTLWLDYFVRFGGLDYIDGLAVHPYVYWDSQPTPDTYLHLLRSIKSKISTRSDLPIYITEMGWPTHQGSHGISPRTAGEYLLESYLMARCLPQVNGLWWYDLSNDGKDPSNQEHNFGIYDAALTPKDAYKSAALIGQINSKLNCKRQIRSGKEDAIYEWIGVGSFNYEDLLARLKNQMGD